MILRRFRLATVTVILGLVLGTLLVPVAGRAEDPANPDNRKADPMSLEQWRQRRQDYVAATKEADPAARVELLEKFLQTYPNWDGRSSVRRLLATSLLDSGTPDLARAQALLDDLTRSPAVSCNFLESVLGIYLAHPELPMASAQTVIQRADSKIAKDRREAKEVESNYDRLAAEGYVDQCEKSLKAMQGKLLWVRGDAVGAVPILREAESLGVRLGIDLLPVDERRRTGGPIPTGRLDEVRLNLAMAYEKIDDPRAAREALSRVLGSQLGESDLERLGALRARLDVELTPVVEVQAPLARASDLTLADLAGKKHRLRDYRGRVVVLNFWSTT
jgi:hypothetical protein